MTGGVSDGRGSFSGSFVIAPSAYGLHNAVFTTGSVSVTRTISISPTLQFSPTSGRVGSTVTIAATGHDAGTGFRVVFGDAGPTVVTVTSGANGSFATTFTVPTHTTRSELVLVYVDSSSILRSLATFNVIP
jgi:hypothetical protein